MAWLRASLLWTLPYISASGYALTHIYNETSPPPCLGMVLSSFLFLFVIHQFGPHSLLWEAQCAVNHETVQEMALRSQLSTSILQVTQMSTSASLPLKPAYPSSYHQE